MSTRDIESHLLEVYGVSASREMISNITDIVTDEIDLWRNRPVDEVYPIVYIDGIWLRIRDKGAVTIKVAHLVVGVDVEGRKHALGAWIAETEGAKFWHSVLTLLRNRGLRDILIACCDGLTGLPEAITTVFPDTVVQTCVVHVIRSAVRFVSYSDRKKITSAMRTIYTTPTVEAAELALKDLDQQWGRQYPGVTDVWQRAWPEFVPFLDYPPELRRVDYTTNAIESINFQLRKITKARGISHPTRPRWNCSTWDCGTSPATAMVNQAPEPTGGRPRSIVWSSTSLDDSNSDTFQRINDPSLTRES
ncbi:hypothetical protein GCM10023199_24970 [Actinomycetospora chibensis]